MCMDMLLNRVGKNINGDSRVKLVYSIILMFTPDYFMQGF